MHSISFPNNSTIKAAVLSSNFQTKFSAIVPTVYFAKQNPLLPTIWSTITVPFKTAIKTATVSAIQSTFI
jgi:hypothetical protein